MINKSELDEFIKSIHDGGFIHMNPADLVFELNSKMNCFYCAKYNNNWRCPPNLPNIDYEKLMLEYDSGIFVWDNYEIKSKEDYSKIRNDSSVVLHKKLLEIEKWLWKHNKSNAISFGAGSCKLCKDGCGKDKCNKPYMSRSPLEATGVNVVKSAYKYGIKISFPTDEHLMRLGLVLYQTEVY